MIISVHQLQSMQLGSAAIWETRFLFHGQVLWTVWTCAVFWGGFLGAGMFFFFLWWFLLGGFFCQGWVLHLLWLLPMRPLPSLTECGCLLLHSSHFRKRIVLFFTTKKINIASADVSAQGQKLQQTHAILSSLGTRSYLKLMYSCYLEMGCV